MEEGQGCREDMRRNKETNILGAVLVACLSMEHITTSFTVNTGKTMFPKLGSRAGKVKGRVMEVGQEVALKMECALDGGLQVGCGVSLGLNHPGGASLNE